MAPQDKQKRKGSGNRLKDDTPFTCSVHFRADLPEIAGAPRMLVTPLQPEKLAQFRLTTLERDPKAFLDIFTKQSLFLGSDLSVPVHLLDIDSYAVPVEAPQLAPEDLALLEDTEAEAKPVDQQTRQPGKQELSWLMRTSYISNEVKAKRQQQAAQEGKLTDLLADELQVIEDGFAAAEVPPQHPSKPGLKAVEVLPVLPDIDTWANKYVVVTFDDNPTREYAPLSDSAAATQRHAAGRSILQSYSTRNEAGQQDKWLALMVPRQAAAPEEPGLLEGDADQDFDWVREYKFRVDNDADTDSLITTCVLQLREDCVTYNRIASRLALQKRPRVAAVRPSKITVRKRPHTEAEEEERAASRQRLSGQGEKYEEGGLQDDDLEENIGTARSSPSPQLSD